MKKEYISPEIEIIEFGTEDIIVTSTSCNQEFLIFRYSCYLQVLRLIKAPPWSLSERISITYPKESVPDIFTGTAKADEKPSEKPPEAPESGMICDIKAA